jgi:hypothetical protein
LHFKLNFKIIFTKLSTFMMEDVFVKDMKISCYNSKLHLWNAHPIHTKNKDKNFNKNHQEYLPTAEKTFIRFWWQWSSGRFSAITMRDCQKNCMLERGREGRERERERERVSNQDTSCIEHFKKNTRHASYQNKTHQRHCSMCLNSVTSL